MNALLLGALVFASTSTFVSCKDYDDDITNLQTQIDKLAKADELKAAVETLNTAVAGAKTDAAAALKAAQAAQATADKKADAATVEALQKSVNDAKAAAEKATADLEAAKTNLETLIASKADQADLDKANEKIAAAEAAIEAAKTAAAEADAALKTEMTQAIAEATKDLVDKAALAAEVQALEGKINSLTSDGIVADLGNLKTQVSDLEDAAKALKIAVSNMITGIQLFGTIHEDTHSNYKPCDHTLTFTTVAELDNVFTAPDGKSIEFKKGNFAVYGDSVVVRVTPANATLTKEMVSLVNSQGAVLEDVVVESVEKFNTLLTRAAVANTGLYTIKFNLKKEYKADAFDEAIKSNDKKVLFAVAAKANVDAADENSNRSVVSEFDLDMNPVNGTKAKDFTVWTAGMETSTGLWDIRNRFMTTEEAVNTTKREDLVWAKNDADKGIVTPAVAATADNTVKKADQPDAYGYWPANDKNDDGFVLRSDNRNTRDLFIAEVNEDIVIDYSVYMNSSYQAYGQRVAGFYVSLDKSHAIESKPSELNAWEGYEIDGLNKLIMGSKGSIKVTSPAANGDVIGFRVFAVNLDGTLVDPDGRAFYVQLGKADKQTIGDLQANFDVEEGTFSTDYIDVEGKFAFEDYEHAVAYFNQVEADAAGYWPVIPTIEFFDAEKKLVDSWSLTNSSNDDSNQRFWRYTDKSSVKYIKLTINKGDATEFIDDATYKYEIKIYRRNEVSTLIRTLDLTMTKVMPTETPGYAYKVAQNELQWVVPYDGDYKIVDGSKDAKIDFFNVLNVEHNAKVWDAATRPDRSQFDITVADGTYAQDVNDNALWKSYSPVIKWIPGDENTMKINNVRSNTVNGKVVVLPYKVDNTTTHAFSATYNFGYISKKYDAASKSYVTGDYKYPVANNPAAMTFCSWTKFFNLKTASEIVNKAETNPWWKDNYNQLVWKATPAVGDPDAMKSLGKLNWEYKKDAGSRVNNELNPATHGGNNFGALLINGYLTIVKKTVNGAEVEDIKVMANGAESPYFTATYDGEGTIEIVQKTNSQRPVAHDETIEFKVEDCFGNQIPVSLPVKVVAKD